jgi:orotate phosphoribosyltransferase
MEKSELAKRIYAVSNQTGFYTLGAGRTQKEHFDKYLFESDPLLLTEIAQKLSEMIPQDAEILAGLELGGIPIATALSLETGLPLAFIRRVSRDLGPKNLAEGADVREKAVCIIEDVTTTGTQIIESALALREMGARVEHVICVIIRDEIAIERMKEVDLELHYLFHMDDLRD